MAKTKTNNSKKTSVKTTPKSSDTKRPKTNEQLLSYKIKQFITEVGDKELLTEEQKRIYKAFTKTKGSATNIYVTDSKGRNLNIKIYSNKFSNGVQYILMGHYKTTREYVTANEILNLCNVIRKGRMYLSKGYTVYRLLHKYNNVTIRTVLKISVKGNEAVLKSFYSDR